MNTDLVVVIWLCKAHVDRLQGSRSVSSISFHLCPYLLTETRYQLPRQTTRPCYSHTGTDTGPM